MGSTPAGPLGTHLRGHFLRFGRQWTPAYDEAAGARLLFIVGGIEVSRIVFPRLASEPPPLWIVLPLHLMLAGALLRFVAGTTLSELGCRSWPDWNRIEKSYFFQQLFILNVAFLIVFAAPLQQIVAESNADAAGAFSCDACDY